MHYAKAEAYAPTTTDLANVSFVAYHTRLVDLTMSPRFWTEWTLHPLSIGYLNHTLPILNSSDPRSQELNYSVHFALSISTVVDPLPCQKIDVRPPYFTSVQTRVHRNHKIKKCDPIWSRPLRQCCAAFLMHLHLPHQVLSLATRLQNSTLTV